MCPGSCAHNCKQLWYFCNLAAPDEWAPWGQTTFTAKKSFHPHAIAHSLSFSSNHGSLSASPARTQWETGHGQPTTPCHYLQETVLWVPPSQWSDLWGGSSDHLTCLTRGQGAAHLCGTDQGATHNRQKSQLERFCTTCFVKESQTSNVSAACECMLCQSKG